MWSLDLCDDSGRRRAFIDSHGGFSLTRRLNSWASVKFDVDVNGRAASELAVAERSVKVWDDGTLRFHGQVWEDLTYGVDLIGVEARGPLAVLPFRRVRSEAVYVAEDAGLIAFDRLTVQNAARHTGLVAGSRQASVDRDRTYLPGKREDEILDELADALDGFFYKETPTDDTAGVRAELDILYPDAGTSREEVRFEYGVGTAANLKGFELVRRLPLNRRVVAASADLGGRIAAAAENAASISTYGLFEDEDAFNDVTDSTLLSEHARAGVTPTPPQTLSLTPGPEAPLLFEDFDVGDFVRVLVKHGPLDIFVWARVLEATLQVDKEGVETLTGLVVETLSGGRISAPHDPALAFRLALDDERRRREALERRVASVDQTPLAQPAEPTPDDQDGPTTPSEPTAPPPPPPAAPPAPPSLSGLAASNTGPGAVGCSVNANGNGSDTVVWFSITGGGESARQSIGAGFATVGGGFSGLAEGTYDVTAHASSAGGTVSSGPVSVFVPFSPFI